MERQLKTSSGFEQFLFHVMCCTLFFFSAVMEICSLIVMCFILSVGVDLNGARSGQA